MGNCQLCIADAAQVAPLQADLLVHAVERQIQQAAGVGAQQRGGQVDDELIEQGLADKGPGQGGAAFHQHLVAFAAAQLGGQGVQVEAAPFRAGGGAGLGGIAGGAGAGQRQQLGAGVFQRPAAVVALKAFSHVAYNITRVQTENLLSVRGTLFDFSPIHLEEYTEENVATSRLHF